MGTATPLYKGRKRPFSRPYWFGTSLITGPRGTGAAGAAGAVTAAGSTFAGLGGLPYWPIGPKTTATASTIAATIAPKMPPTDSDDMKTHPCSRCASDTMVERKAGRACETPTVNGLF